MNKSTLNFAILIFALITIISGSVCAKDGDLNGDGFVSFLDLESLAGQWLNADCSVKDWCNGVDLNRSDRVDLADFAIWANYWIDSQVLIEAQIESLISQMTLAEKVEQMGGDTSGFSTADNERLGIPGFLMADGPQGVRWGQATCFPNPMALAATWEPAIIEQVGAAMGREFRGKGRYVALAPCINIVRDPRCGRSFETLGEDPYLSSKLAPAYIKGIQSEKVIACAKHFACNNQENGRFSNNVQVNERTLREIYLPAFKGCVQQENVWSVMSAYNKVNNDYCSANSHLLSDVLKNDWGFKGFVVSDWGACHSTVKSANAGLDVEMPTASYFGQPLINAVNAAQVSMDTIDEAVRRILRSKFWAGVFDEPVVENPSLINTTEHQALVRDAGRKSIVLLKNNNSLLPLNEAALTRIAVIGPNANVARPCGGGSVYVTPYYDVSPLEGIQNKVGGSVQVDFALGCTIDGSSLYAIPSSALKPSAGSPEQGLAGDYYNNMDLSGIREVSRIDETVDFNWGGSPATGIGPDEFSVRWNGKLVPRATGLHTIGTTTDDGSRLWVNSVLLVNDWTNHAEKTNTGAITLTEGVEYDVTFEYYENSGNAVARFVWSEPDANTAILIDEAVQLAAVCDAAIVCVGTSAQIESEGFDRVNLDLSGLQDELVSQVAAANPNTVVVLVNGSAVVVNDWIDDVNSALECWFGGQEAGNAIADVLFGDENPAGKLPITIPKDVNQLAVFDNNYEAPGDGPGYRYYDRNQIVPEFVFGHGLSYTTFAYSNLSLEPAKIWSDGGQIEISFDVQNTGSVAGDEIVQLYIHDVNSTVLMAVKQLKGFKRISLSPSQTETVTLTVPVEDLAYYDVNNSKFVVEGGDFDVMVGSSSADIRLTGGFHVVSVDWAQAPVATGPNSIMMSAAVSDANDSDKEYYFQCVAGGGNDSGWQTSSMYEDTGLDSEILYTYHLKARDINNHQNITEWSSERFSATEDNTVPTPNPPTWAAPPAAAGATAISMTATVASDISGVEYSFVCVSGDGNDSGWQDSPTYIDSQLTPDTLYSYQVQVCDKSPNQNTTGFSSTASATTEPEDNTPPTPNPPTWAVTPSAAGATAITMTATEAIDASGVEYSFVCVSGDGNDSGWQDSPTYTDSQLTPDTLYSYQVQVRDKSPSQNTTGFSSTASATTEPNPSVYLLAHWRLDEFSGDDINDSSGNGYNGSLYGNPVWQPAGGWINGAIDLDGTGDYVRIDNEFAFDISDVITVSCWIKVNVFDRPWASIVTKGDSSWRLARSQTANVIEFACSGISNNQYGYIAGSVNVNDGLWHHVAGVYDGTRIYLYIDGVEDVSEAATGSISLNNYNVLIGENGQAGGRTWNGLIDDVRVYHHALPAEDIFSIYNGDL